MVKAVKTPGRKPQVVTNKASKGMALQRVREVCVASAHSVLPSTPGIVTATPLDNTCCLRNHSKVQ